MIRPMGNKVVVKPMVRQLSSVLIVKNTEPFNEGTVVATGPKATEISVGDFIKYGNGDYLKWPTHNIDGQDYQIISEMDICAVVVS